MIGRLRFVGLTGGIGSGKSTVAGMLRARGVPVVDADELAREVVAPGQPALAEIAAAWPDAIAAGGALDRKRLAARVFSDPAARARLEAITHPRIQDLALARARDLEGAGHRLAFYEASLLVETGRYGDFDGVLVVAVDPEHQIARAMARDGLSRADAEARLAAQLPLADKRALADWVVDNSGDLAATRSQVDDVLAELGFAPAPPAGSSRPA